MKTRYILFITALLIIFSCTTKDEYIFDKSPDERLIEKIDEYNSTLTGASNGWIMTIETKVNGVYRLWIKFKADNRVEMLSDMDATWNTKEATSALVKESSYKIKAMQTPTLIFDTYNYIHLMADPQGTNPTYGNINGGVNGDGLKSDFEFFIEESTSERINLTGRYNSVTAYLEKATATQESAVKEGGLKTVHQKLNSYMASIKYPVIEVNGIKVDVAIGNRETGFTYIVDDQMVIEKCSSYPDLTSVTDNMSSSSIKFINPIDINGTEISALSFDAQGYYYDKSGTKNYMYDHKKPSVPLRLGYKLDYTKLLVDDAQLQGTLVNPFLQDVYLASRATMATSGSRYMQYVTLSFELHPTSGEPIMKLVLRYNNTAGTVYNATWLYRYRIESNGDITFYERMQTGSTNEAGREPYFRLFVDYFCKVTYISYNTSSWANTVVDKYYPVTFKIDWAENNTPGSSSKIGGFYPVDNPTNFCCGILSK